MEHELKRKKPLVFSQIEKDDGKRVNEKQRCSARSSRTNLWGRETIAVRNSFHMQFKIIFRVHLPIVPETIPTNNRHEEDNRQGSRMRL